MLGLFKKAKLIRQILRKIVRDKNRHKNRLLFLGFGGNMTKEGHKVMKHYRCLVKKGHFGTGKYLERVIIVQASNVIEAIEKAKIAPGVKKGGNALFGATSILAVEPASYFYDGN